MYFYDFYFIQYFHSVFSIQIDVEIDNMSNPDLSSEVIPVPESEVGCFSRVFTQNRLQTLSKISLDLSSLNNPKNTKLLDNYKYNFNLVEKDFSDVALYF